jgi:hypothetical protein
LVSSKARTVVELCFNANQTQKRTEAAAAALSSGSKSKVSYLVMSYQLKPQLSWPSCKIPFTISHHTNLEKRIRKPEILRRVSFPDALRGLACILPCHRKDKIFIDLEKALEPECQITKL